MASRKEEKEQRRQERLERERRARESGEQRKRMLILALAVVVVAAVVVLVVVLLAGGEKGGGEHKGTKQGTAAFKGKALKPPARQIRDLQDAADKAGCTIKKFRSEGRDHLKPKDRAPKYKTDPPTSGPHSPNPLEDGAYSEIGSDGTLRAVHSLEHGRVVYQHRGISTEDERRLKGLFDEDDYHVLLIPNETEMPYEVAATSWTRLVSCKKMTPAVFDVLRAFKEKNVDRGPELVP